MSASAKTRTFALVVGGAGVLLLIGGLPLIALGGSWYYFWAGAAMVATGVMLWCNSVRAEKFYAVFLLLTLIWACWESGLNPWALAARTLALAVLGFGFLTAAPPIPQNRGRGWASVSALLCMAITGLAFIPYQGIRWNLPVQNTDSGAVSGQADARDWQNYGNDLSGTRFVKLSQITPQNVAQLEPAWLFRSGEYAPPDTPPGNAEATPLEVGGLVYTCTPRNVVIAIDASEGTERWRFDPHADVRGHVFAVCRGVTYYPGSGGAGSCSARIISTTPAAELFALDALRGTPCPDFGNNGRVSLLSDLGEVDTTQFFPAQPVLADIPTREGLIPGLIQATKRGEIFVLDRRDGRPIVAATERAVPQGAVVGDWTYLTQPFSALSVAPKPLTERAMWGLTPIDQMVCRLAFRRSGYRGLFTPPGLLPGIQDPGLSGVLDWGGVSVDEDRKLIVFNSSDIPWTLQLRPRERDPDPHPVTPMLGTPYTAHAAPFLGLFGAPCSEPPWGHLHVVDLQTGSPVGLRILGTSRDTGPFGFRVMPALPIGALSSGGTITTASGLIFVSGTTDQYLRAFDIKDGRELWRARLPAGGQATPMSYMARERQFVVISAGGNSVLGTKPGDFTIAYALPKRASPLH